MKLIIWFASVFLIGTVVGSFGIGVYEDMLIGEGILVPDGVGVRVVYEEPDIADDEYEDELEIFISRTDILEEIAAVMNERLRNPPELDLWLGNCGEANAYYSQSRSKIIICYELLAEMAETLEEEQDIDPLKTINNTMYFVLFHELGHALIDKYDLPVTGREEDAVDQLAIMFFVENEMEEALEASALFFKRKMDQDALNEIQDETSFWDDHGLNAQRYYNILCWAYGKDTKENEYIVANGYLPRSRADKCEYEYYRLRKSWQELLEPHVNPR